MNDSVWWAGGLSLDVLDGLCRTGARGELVMSPMVPVGVAGAILLSPLTFVPGCELTPPKVSSHYVGPGGPIARDRRVGVDLFLAGRMPDRHSVSLGDIEIRARSRNTSVINLLEYARREARRLGGDAVVNVHIDQALQPSRAPCAGTPAARLTLTGQVVRWLPAGE